MAVRSRKDFQKQLLPPGMLDLVQKVILRLCNLSLIFLGGFLAVCFWSYSPTDPSLNTSNISSEVLPVNLLGFPGALISDLFIQIFGASSFLFVGVLAIWGVRSLFGFPLQRPLLKGVGLFLCLVFGAMLLAPFAPPSSWSHFSSLGGAVGQLTQSFKGNLVVGGYFAQAFNLLALAPVVVALFLAMLFYTLDLSWRQFWNVTKNSIRQMIWIWTWGRNYLIHQRPKKEKSKINQKDTLGVRETFFEEQEIPQEDDPAFDSTIHFDENALLSSVYSENFQSTGEEDDQESPLPQSSSSSRSSAIRFPESALVNEDYELPSIDLLDPAVKKAAKVMTPEMVEESARQLERVLEEFGVRGEIVHVRPGPVVTLYELKPAAGIKTSRVIGLADDIARSMSALSTRIAVIPGRNVIGIEMPNALRETVYLRDLLLSEEYARTTASLPLILGKEIGGAPIIADLVRMPHLLVAGTTGSGKSVAINTMILSLLYRLTPDQCRFIMIDPKMLELSVYDDIPHLLAPVVTDPKKAVVALKWAVREMENRYRSMSKLGVRNIDGYNVRIREARASGELLMRRVQTGFDPDSGKPMFENQSLDLEVLPHIVIIVDEMADLMLVAGKEIEVTVQRLAQMARAAGIHLIMATQRPSVDVITGTIKANFPTRISFQVTSKIDSRTILGDQGAEQLLGQGDMLYMAGGGRVIRVHGPLVRDNEVERISKFVKLQGDPSYVEGVTEDDDLESSGSDEGQKGGDTLYTQAVEIVLREGKASTSFVQRHLQIGYNRAARIIEDMEKKGIISAANHAGKREVLGR